MSYEAMQWVAGEAPVADTNEFAVLASLACKADRDGCGALLPTAMIAEQARISRRTVMRRLSSLEERRLITRGASGAYDLMIPYRWFEDIDEIDAWRRSIGRPPLTPDSRPDLPPAPAKARRKDAVDDGRSRKPIPKHVRAAVYERDGYECRKCGAADDLTLDHIFPWSLGGSDTEENLQVLCRPCNSRKRARVEAIQ